MSDDNQLLKTFTSVPGYKYFYHQEAMQKLRDGVGMPIVTHIMPTDICNFKCAFCSVQYREGDTLTMAEIRAYLDQLVPLGLKAVIISGGGNPLLYKCPLSGAKFDELIDEIHGRGLEIGVITNGMKMKQYPCGRTSWLNCKPETLDKLTWVRISLSGWDHKQDECETPDIDPTKTTIGGSYVLHDEYLEPADKKHGRVSTLADVITPLEEGDGRVRYGMDRLEELKVKMKEWADKYKPRYVRLLPNCLEPALIPARAEALRKLAEEIDPNVFFVQVKPPQQPRACYKGYPHPVLNCDGYVYPCDSVVLSSDSGHKFGEAWRICHLTEIGELYSKPIKPNVPNNICAACVFTAQVEFLADVVDGMETPAPIGPTPEHVNFI